MELYRKKSSLSLFRACKVNFYLPSRQADPLQMIFLKMLFPFFSVHYKGTLTQGGHLSLDSKIKSYKSNQCSKQPTLYDSRPTNPFWKIKPYMMRSKLSTLLPLLNFWWVLLSKELSVAYWMSSDLWKDHHSPSQIYFLMEKIMI